ncbi:MAG: RDD family protein [Mycobacteriales bacterium]
MARWTGTWMSGPAAAGAERRPEGVWPGRRYGFPQDGSGAVATTGAKLAALLVDIAVGALIGGLLNAYLGDPTSLQRTLATNGSFALQVILLQSLTGQSMGMRLLGIRVARLADPAGIPGFLPAAVRTALLFLVLPAVILDRDGRGLHDKAAGTVVLRVRPSRSAVDERRGGGVTDERRGGGVTDERPGR